MRNAEVLKPGKRADGRCYQIIGNDEERADDRDDFAAMSHTRVDTAPVRIKPADDHVVEADQRRKHAHRRDQPERCVAGDRERETDHIGFAGTPVAVQNRSRARHIYIARTFNVGWYQLMRLTRGRLARRDASLQESDLRHPLHFNDADEVSCRAGAIKCSRCRASFAPISPAFTEQKLVPPLDRQLVAPLGETKNWQKLPTGKYRRQELPRGSQRKKEFASDEESEESRSVSVNLIIALVLCFTGALLEELCAGSGVKEYLAKLKWPSFSPPLWAWYAIAVAYYAIVFVCAYR